jgi:hypothetical protein
MQTKQGVCGVACEDGSGIPRQVGKVRREMLRLLQEDVFPSFSA